MREYSLNTRLFESGAVFNFYYDVVFFMESVNSTIPDKNIFY